MKIANNLTELVGNTPMVEIKSLSEKTGARIIAKLEYFNPLSSVKDRIALNMIETAEREGKIKPGDLLVEPTSGNTGIGLAFVAASKGYRLILTMPDTMSVERRKILEVLGAQLELTPGAEGMKGAIKAAKEIHQKNPGSLLLQQFDNPANPDTHRRTTAQEILNDTEGKFDFFVAGIGTGGTITGCGETLKENIPNLKVVAVEPEASAVLSRNEPGPHKIQGIGAGFVPGILNTEIYDEIVTIVDEDAADMAKKLAKTEGLLVGISSGAAMLAATQIAEKAENKGKTIVVMLPDSGERYLSTWIFD